MRPLAAHKFLRLRNATERLRLRLPNDAGGKAGAQARRQRALLKRKPNENESFAARCVKFTFRLIISGISRISTLLHTISRNLVYNKLVTGLARATPPLRLEKKLKLKLHFPAVKLARGHCSTALSLPPLSLSLVGHKMHFIVAFVFIGVQWHRGVQRINFVATGPIISP